LSESPEITTRRRRVAELDRELAGLQAQHDLAMSAFQFDEASALQRRIGALDDERRPLAAALPEPTLPPEPITPGARSRAPTRRGRPGRRP
jgi:hypothetical protein